MALTVVAAGSGANATTSAATLSVTLGVAFAVGDMVVVCIASDNLASNTPNHANPTLTGFSNVLPVQGEVVYSPGALAADGTDISMWAGICTSARITSNTITLNWGTAVAAKCAVLWKISSDTKETITWNDGISLNGSTTGAPSLTIPNGLGMYAAVPVGAIVIGFVGIESNVTVTGDGDTTNGTWSSVNTQTGNTGTLLTSQRIASQAKKQTTAPSLQQWDPTFTSADQAIQAGLFIAGPPVARTLLHPQAVLRAATR